MFIINNKKCNRFNAFTLAETLITLGIIGVVAALTIPILNTNIQKEFQTQYKKAFSISAQAITSASGNTELVYVPAAANNTARNINFYYFRSYFKVSDDCGTVDSAGSPTYAATPTDCWANGEQYNSQPSSSNLVSFIDNSGMTWAQYSPNASSASNLILVDTNGIKGPNVFGQDRFPIYIVDGSNYMTNTLPVKITSDGDYTSTNATYCPSGNTNPCYYQSWLYN